MEKVDVTIIGAGVIGLAVSYLLSKSNKNIVVIEKNYSFGQETSSRNSEVIHAGLYYEPGSLKAETCVKGSKFLYELCENNDIPYRKLGKLVSAVNNEEIERIKQIFNSASNCGVENLSFFEEKEIKKFNPDISAKLAIFSPETGIIDSHRLMDFFHKKSEQSGVIFAFLSEAVGIRKQNSVYEITIKESSGNKFIYQAKKVINCAGLNSDKIAQMVGIDIDKFQYRLHYCKGQYFRVANPKKFSIHHLIYPPPTKVSLGIHLTPDLSGGLRLGPDDRYVAEIEYSVNDADKVKFYESVRSFLPKLKMTDLIPDTAGVRPKLQSANDSFRDFIIREESAKNLPGFINLIGIESPGLTACMAIAEKVKDLLKIT